MTTVSCVHDTPVGKLTLHSNGEAITGVEFEGNKYPLPKSPRGDDAVLKKARKQLDEYFAGKRKEFDLPLAPSGTPFQMKCWKALRRIPYGATRSYGQQASTIGSPKAVRAVGLANGRNPIPVIIPCHRVIGANGSLTGFGGGLDRKKLLLDLEQGALPLRC